MADIVEPNLDGSASAPPSKPQFIGAVGAGMLIAIVVLMIPSHAVLLAFGKLAPAMAICVLVHLTTFYLLARLGGVTVETVSYFYGGALIRFRRGATWFAFNWLPIGGSVRMKGMDGPTHAAEPVAGSWYRLSRPARAGFCLMGPLAVLVLALSVLGWPQFRAELLHLPGQFRDLFTRAPAAVGGAFYFIDHAPFCDVLGAAAVTLAIVNLFPLPIMNGGQAILQFFDPDPRSTWFEWLQLVSTIVVVALLLIVIYGGLAVSLRE